MKIPFSAYDFFGYLASGFFLLVAIDYAFNGGRLLEEEHSVAYAIFWVAVAYVAGHVVAHLAGAVLEQGVVRKLLRSPEESLFDEQRPGGLLPRVFLGFYKPLPPETRRTVLQKAEKVAGIATPGRGLFFHCHPIVMREEVAQERLGAFLNLYGFCRNLAVTMILCVPILIAGAYLVDSPESALSRHRLLWAGAALVAAVFLFYRYLKFFRHYTVEVYRVYAALSIQKEGTGGDNSPTPGQ
jgi:hypothetical protein